MVGPWLRSLPVEAVVAFLFAVVFCRAQATYWLGRAARRGVDGRVTRRAEDARPGSRGIQDLLDRPRARRAVAWIDRWGWPVIPLSFLTIGFQTVVNAAAGALRIGWPRYTLAMIPGCIAWAVIYATVGFAVVEAWLRAAAQSGWFALALVLAAALAVIVVLRHRRARRRALTQ